MIRYKNRLVGNTGIFYRIVKIKIHSGYFKMKRGRTLAKAYVMVCVGMTRPYNYSFFQFRLKHYKYW